MQILNFKYIHDTLLACLLARCLPSFLPYILTYVPAEEEGACSVNCEAVSKIQSYFAIIDVTLQLWIYTQLIDTSLELNLDRKRIYLLSIKPDLFAMSASQHKSVLIGLLNFIKIYTNVVRKLEKFPKKVIWQEWKNVGWTSHGSFTKC